MLRMLTNCLSLAAMALVPGSAPAQEKVGDWTFGQKDGLCVIFRTFDRTEERKDRLMIAASGDWSAMYVVSDASTKVLGQTTGRITFNAAAKSSVDRRSIAVLIEPSPDLQAGSVMLPWPEQFSRYLGETNSVTIRIDPREGSKGTEEIFDVGSSADALKKVKECASQRQADS